MDAGSADRHPTLGLGGRLCDEAQLPLRYAFVVEPPAGGQGEGGPHFCASEVWTDDGSCWEALRAVAALSVPK